MDYEECISIVAQFKQSFPYSVMSQKVHGFQVALKNGEPILQITIKPDFSLNSLEIEEKGSDTYNYSFENETKNIQTEVVHAQVPRATARAGTSARGIGLNGRGTAGWNIYFTQYNAYVCLSNWHVLCSQGNNTRLGSGVEIDGQPIASLYTYQPLRNKPQSNTWDYAIARYNNQTDCEGHFRLCQNNNEFPYPQSLSKNVSLNDTMYRKVGDRSPICREGRLIAIGDRDIDYPDNQTRSFTGQLIFSKMSDPGDSGSVIVNASDNTVTGLNFAGNDDETIANPLYKLGWGFIGSVIFSTGNEVPILNGNPFILSGEEYSSSNSNFMEASAPVFSHYNFEVPQIPTGKHYLGLSIRRVWKNGATAPGGGMGTEEWFNEIPPISPAGNTYVLIGTYDHWRETGGSGGAAIDYTDYKYMVFG